MYMHVLELLLAITGFSRKNSLVISSIMKGRTGPKNVERLAMRPATGLATGLGTRPAMRPRKRPATRPARELEGIKSFSIGLITRLGSVRKLSPSQIDICYNHQH